MACNRRKRIDKRFRQSVAGRRRQTPKRHHCLPPAAAGEAPRPLMTLAAARELALPWPVVFQFNGVPFFARVSHHLIEARECGA